MSIKALPQTTVRAIGAAQVLTDPSAVVKELVDNALDARATSIAVEIHANTLDVIQVRDNGHGIPPQDRLLVARRYCTSKFTNSDDLATIGGSSLGFRGEALASAAEMSGGMTVTTRVEGEQVATALKINQQGEVAAQERASTAIGTTVKITDFIKTNPVRRQVALKHTDQALKRVKHLLQSFAFARPHVRYSLKVTKAKNDKGNWMYAPKAGGNAEDAAFKIVGAACASQCAWSVIEEYGFTLQAFLPKPDAVAERVSNVGAYVSVDHRPLTVSRGLSKQAVKIFRETLKNSDSRFEGIKDPFLFLEITCPERAYDPNIEPAKDDVLFEDANKVVTAIRKLFAAAYPVIEVPEPACNNSSGAHAVPAQDDNASAFDEDDFLTSLEQEQSIDPSRSVTGQIGDISARIDQSENNPPHSDKGPIARGPHVFRPNMYGCDEEDLMAVDARPSSGRTEADFEELQRAHKDVNISNPWVMAKLNASNRQVEVANSGAANTEPQQKKVSTIDKNAAGPDYRIQALPTPRPSSPTAPFHPSDHVPDLRLANDGRIITSSSPGQNHVDTTPEQTRTTPGALITPSPSQQRPRPAYNYNVTSQSDLSQGTPLSAIPQARPQGGVARSGRAKLNKPFVSPLVEDASSREKVWFDHLEGIEDRDRRRLRRRPNEVPSPGLVQQGETEESPRSLTPPRRNRDIRDFVSSLDLTGDEGNPAGPPHENTRSAQAFPSSEPLHPDEDENMPNNYGALSGRGFVPASELAALEARVGSIGKPMAPPPKRRKTGQGVLRQISGNAPPAVEEAEADQEYRPETTSRRRSSAKLQRTKSSRLPLERVPAGKVTHNLSLKRCMTTAELALEGQILESSYSFLGWNVPAIDAYDVFAEDRSEAEIEAISKKLHELLINKVSDGEMVQDLGKMVSAALSAHKQNTRVEDEGGDAPSQEMLDDVQ